ncbi:MAG: hypothetical protein ACLUNZ_05435 [Evtepia sp.]
MVERLLPMEPDGSVAWSYALPGLQICQLTGGQGDAWLSDSLRGPVCLLFCQAGGLQLYLEQGQVLDLNPRTFCSSPPACGCIGWKAAKQKFSSSECSWTDRPPSPR